MCNERCSSNSSACASTMQPTPSLPHPLSHPLFLSLAFSLFRRPSISPTCKRRWDLSGDARTRNAGSACVQVHVRCTYAAACACTRTPREAGEARMSSLHWREGEKGRKRKRGKRAGSDRPKEGRWRNAEDGKACEKDSFQSVSPDRGMASWTRNEKDESRRRWRR